MLGRCYNPKHTQYDSYGAKGVFVEEYFFDFGNYVSFVSRLPNYDNLLCEPEKWQIDKDMSGQKIYSRETINIIPAAKNLEMENEKKIIPVCMIDDSKRIIANFRSISEADRMTGIHKGNIARAVRKGCRAGGYFWRANNDSV